MNGVPGYAGAIVNPSLTAAIESTRQFLQGKGVLPESWPGLTEFPNWQGHFGNTIDDPAQLIRWQPDCRATVLCFEALAGMAFVKVKDGPDDAKVRCQLGVYGQGGVDASPFVPLVTMTRPTARVVTQQAGLVADLASDRLLPKSDDLASRDRLTEITAQVVPPFAFWCAILPIHPDRMPRTIELIQLTLSLASFAEQRFKHALAVPRPQYFNPRVFPAILTPAHSSLPSGHSTEAFAVSNVLYALMSSGVAAQKQDSTQPLKTMLMALAARIANNRQVAGLHTPIDTVAGRLLGTVLSDYLVARCIGGTPRPGAFNGAELSVGADGLLARGGKTAKATNDTGLELGPDGDDICIRTDAVSIQKSAALEWLWDEAREEWGAQAAPQ